MDLVYEIDKDCWNCSEEKITCGINATKKSVVMVYNFCSHKCRCNFIKEENEKRVAKKRRKTSNVQFILWP